MSDNPTKIGTYFNVFEAQLAKSKLDAYEIFCFLQDENIVQTDWFRAIAYGGVKLFVREEDVEKALEILKEEEQV